MSILRRFEEELREYIIAQGWKVSFPTTWQYEFAGDHEVFFPKDNFEPTVRIQTIYATRPDGTLAAPGELRVNCPEGFSVRKDVEIPGFLLDVYEGTIVEDGNTLHQLNVNVMAEGFLLIVSVFSVNKEANEKTLDYLKTIRR